MITKHVKRSLFVVVFSMASLLAGCSTAYYEQPRVLPVLPEIARPKRVSPPKKVVVKKPLVSSASVRRYSVKKPKVKDIVITQKDINSVLLKSGVDVENPRFDPYAAIPDSSSSVVLDGGISKPSPETIDELPAVKSLLIRAQADLAIGRTSSAVSKLERALRIDSRNAKLWSLLAKAHYDQSEYPQAISMAKKSIRYSNNETLIGRNWALIKKAGLQSSDTIVVEEANNYIKLNP